MCDHSVIESVKQRMLSRREFMCGGAAAVAGAAAGVLPSPVAEAQFGRNMTDLTYTLDETFPTFSGNQQYFATPLAKFAERGFNVLEVRFNEHTGTHMDAPLHFSADGLSVDEIRPINLVAPLCIIGIRARAALNPDAQVTPADVQRWESINGDIPPGACVAMLSGWGKRAGSPAEFRNADASGVMHFPGFHPETAQMLLEKDVAGLAVDTLSIDHGPSQDFGTHYTWLPQNRWGLECVANLDTLPEKGATLVIGAPKHRGGSGGPARVFCFHS